MIALIHHFAASNGDIADQLWTIEAAESIRACCRGKRIITDDNMSTEWGG